MVGSHASYTARTSRRAAATLMVAAIVLTACAARHPADNGVGVSYRNPASVLAGTTRFDADRFAGDWVARACIGLCTTAMNFRVSQTGALVETNASGSRTYVVEAPGVLRRADGNEALVVMWVDDGFRTAAVGSSTGRRAAIIDRARDGGADRIAAAAEILDFNGWDTDRLRKVE